MKEIWNKIFPLRVGERVRIVSTSAFEVHWAKVSFLIGRYGTIDYILGGKGWDKRDLFVCLDHRIRGIKKVHLNEIDVVRVRQYVRSRKTC